MCSIIGVLDPLKKEKFKKKYIFKLNNLLKHRGPDNVGYYNDDIVSLGFNRLSIIDLKQGNQPIVKDNIVSIFNGEIYNFKEIKKELERLGVKFFSNSDSEVVANAFYYWGIDCIKKFNGMFAIGIYNLKEKIFFLIRDRLGIKPIYYSSFDNKLLFASEIKGIINYPNFKKKINYNALSSYLSFRYPTNDKDIFFKNIQRLPNGNYLEFDLKKNNFKVKKYWEIPEIKTNHKLKENDYIEKLDLLLNKSIERQLVSDVPLGVFLSGGLDSSLLSAITAKKLGRNLKTYSVNFENKKYDEGSKSTMISKFIGSDHENLIVTKENFLENLNTVVRIKDTPVSIPHEYPIYLLSKEMKKNISVVLSGEGADEFFGGYSRVQKSPFDYKKNIFNFFRNNSNSFKQFFLSKYKWFSLDEKNELLTQEIKKNINEKSVLDPWNKILKNETRDLFNTVLMLFQNNHLKCLLDRLDIMTMSSSIEARVPFLDHELVEFINSVPFNLKIKWKSNFHKFKSFFSNSFQYSEKNDINKYILRKVSKKYLPHSTTEEKKLGFPLPMNEWMKDNRIKEILLDKSTIDRGVFNKISIEKFLNQNQSDFDEYDFSGKKIWMMVNFELWAREHFN
jgi:asparagine synthase (glutamine-hydrolysing)